MAASTDFYPSFILSTFGKIQEKTVMGRAHRGKKPKKVASDEEFDSGDQPDPESEDFFKDDIDKFHANREKILLDKDQDDEEDSESEIDQEEVMGLDLQESDEDESEDDGDVEDEDDEDDNNGLPSGKAWGKRKQSFYDADVGEADIDVVSDEEAWALEQEEEEEALALQKSMAAALDEQDFDIIESTSVDDHEEGVTIEEDHNKVAMDLTKLTKEQKLEILARDSPELFELLDEIKTKLKEVVEVINPLMEMVQDGKVSDQGAQYIQLKHKLYLKQMRFEPCLKPTEEVSKAKHYCINIAFYLRLKAQQTAVKDHPVIARIVQYRTLIKELEPLDIKLEEDVKRLLAYKNHQTDEIGAGVRVPAKGTELNRKKKRDKIVKKKKKKVYSLLGDSDGSDETEDEVTFRSLVEKKTKKRKHYEQDTPDPLAYYEEIRLKKKKAKEMKEIAARLAHKPKHEMDLNEEEGGKRAITYNISKNKGLTAKKKKQERNPRVKHKKKYGKALIKRKSQVRPVVNEQTRYGGEASGIRAQLSRSVKIK